MNIGYNRQLWSLTEKSQTPVEGIKCYFSFIWVGTRVKNHVTQGDVSKEMRVSVHSFYRILEGHQSFKTFPGPEGRAKSILGSFMDWEISKEGEALILELVFEVADFF